MPLGIRSAPIVALDAALAEKGLHCLLLSRNAHWVHIRGCRSRELDVLSAIWAEGPFILTPNPQRPPKRHADTARKQK